MHYAKDGPDDLLMTIEVTNAGPEAATLHVLPTAWFRNTWSFDAEADKPELVAAPAPAGQAGTARVTLAHPIAGEMELLAAAGPGGAAPQVLCCENETNVARLFGGAPVTPYPKDGINDHVVSGAATVSPDGRGTKCAFWYRLTVAAGATARLRVRLRGASGDADGGDPLGDGFDAVVAGRRAEADEFYAEQL